MRFVTRVRVSARPPPTLFYFFMDNQLKRMKLKKRCLVVILLAVAAAAVVLWMVTQKPGEQISLENTLFTTYTSEAVDFQHPDDVVPAVLLPTPEGIPIYDIRVKSHDFDENKTGLMYETSAGDNEWCRIKQLTSSLWAYYFDDYHYYWEENGLRLNPDFNDVVVLVWRLDDSLKIKAIGAEYTTFRNELWVGGELKLDNVTASLGVVLEGPAPSKLR